MVPKPVWTSHLMAFVAGGWVFNKTFNSSSVDCKLCNVIAEAEVKAPEQGTRPNPSAQLQSRTPQTICSRQNQKPAYVTLLHGCNDTKKKALRRSRSGTTRRTESGIIGFRGLREAWFMASRVF